MSTPSARSSVNSPGILRSASKVGFSVTSPVMAGIYRKPVFRGPWRWERTALQLLIARVSTDCERTHVTVNGEMLVKVIDEHDVAVVGNL
jgi:hypothetical protein